MKIILNFYNIVIFIEVREKVVYNIKVSRNVETRVSFCMRKEKI